MTRKAGSGVRVLASASASLLALAVLGVAAPQARAAVVSCPAVIISCGCTITDTALHTLGNNLNASQGLNKDGSCIDIKKPFATLDGDGFDVDGAGSGIGIRILKGARRASVQNFFEIDDWAVGIEDDADGAAITLFDANGNTSAGVFLKSAKRSVVDDWDGDDNATGLVIKGGGRHMIDDFDADDATADGIDIIKSKGNQLIDFDADDDGGEGVSLVGSDNNSIFDFSADDDVADGVTLERSNSNAISTFNADDNGGNGVHLVASNKNVFDDYDADDNAADGVLLDPHSNNNRAGFAITDDNGANGTEVSSGSRSNTLYFTNSFANTGTDLVDGNTNCDKDQWANMCFDTESQACIGVEGTTCPHF